LENTKKVVAEFKEKLSATVRRQEKLDIMKKKDFRRGKLLEKCIIKILYKWDDRNLKRGVMLEL